MKNGNKTVELVGKSKEIVLRHGHKFLVKPGFLIIKEHRNTYAVTFINDFSARFYQGTTGGIIRVDIDPREFARRFNIAENFVANTIVPRMRERIWEWNSRDATLNESLALAVDAVKKYSIDDLCDRTEYLILDSVGESDSEHYSWFVRTMCGVYEHRTIPPVFTECWYDCEGFVVLTKSRLEKLREAEARLYAEAEGNMDNEIANELAIDINYSELFEEPSEEFRYKNPESFDDFEFKNIPKWRKPDEKLPPYWWRETRDDDTEE